MDDVSAIANENLKSRMAEVERCKGALAHRAIRLWEQMTNQPSPPLEATIRRDRAHAVEPRSGLAFGLIFEFLAAIL